MDKRVWGQPITMVQKFEANEYVAACGDSGTTYFFECNAPGGILYYYRNGDGKIDGVYNGSDRARELGWYTPCSAKHEADATDDFYDGFVDYNWNRCQDPGEGVIVWRGRWGRNGHATKNLNMDEWEIGRS